MGLGRASQKGHQFCGCFKCISRLKSSKELLWIWGIFSFKYMCYNWLCFISQSKTSIASGDLTRRVPYSHSNVWPLEHHYHLAYFLVFLPLRAVFTWLWGVCLFLLFICFTAILTLMYNSWKVHPTFKTIDFDDPSISSLTIGLSSWFFLPGWKTA
jgi:hypothetical protein